MEFTAKESNKNAELKKTHEIESNRSGNTEN